MTKAANGERGCSTAELAKAVGVSSATVSRVFNNHPYVTPEIRRKVREAACRLGYRLRIAPNALRGAILVERLDESQMQSYLNKMFCAIGACCERRNVMLEIIGSGSLHLLNENFIRGAISLKRVLTRETMAEVPNTRFVCMNFTCSGCASVMSDDAQGIEIAVNYLREHGHRRIGLVLPVHDPNSSAQRRLNKFAELIAGVQPGAPSDWTVYLNENPVERIALLLRRQHSDALLIAGEDMALQVNYALSLLNMKVPDDISIVAYENFQASRYMVPPHTTVVQDFDLLAEHAVEALIGILEDRIVPDEIRIQLPNQMIERESVRCRK